MKHGLEIECTRRQPADEGSKMAGKMTADDGISRALGGYSRVFARMSSRARMRDALLVVPWRVVVAHFAAAP
jgi:hypothetical protein